MRDEEQIQRIAEVVKDTLAADFDIVRILEVKVHSDVDSDSEEILRIEVIFEGAPKDVDVKMLSGVVRHVRPKLTEIGERAFPLFSFISNSDARISGLATP